MDNSKRYGIGGNIAQENDFIEFAHLYMQLNERQKAQVHWHIVRVFIKKAICHPNRESIAQAVNTFIQLTWPDIRRFVPALVLSLAFLIVFAWTFWR